MYRILCVRSILTLVSQDVSPRQVSSWGSLDCNAVQCCERISTFQRFVLPRFSGWSVEDWGSVDLWNVGILPQHYTASRPRRPRLEASSPWKHQNSHSFRCSNQNVCVSIFSVHATCPTNRTFLNFITVIKFGEGFKYILWPLTCVLSR
jgi:hypothetical protein